MFLIRYIRTLVQSSCELIGASLEPICEQRDYEGYRCERKEVPVGGGGKDKVIERVSGLFMNFPLVWNQNSPWGVWPGGLDKRTE